jgi:hypothetical protein
MQLAVKEYLYVDMPISRPKFLVMKVLIRCTLVLHGTTRGPFQI